ncbi:MAG: biotin--[acetyl-CoA-carboxylase] ligase [Deltaproteobacteria bacterium]|nr:biotin--[acetyl-CoA-carboxylase] ligase [Deltaproteobacteria bacterium]
MSNDLAPEVVLPALASRRLGRSYEFLPACGSTNDEVASRAAAGAQEGLLVAADVQTAGRGRRGRVWHSPSGDNLYGSLLLRPALPARLAAPLALLAGAALGQTLAALGFSPRLKWPNDVLLDTPAGLRKVAGVLAEMTSEGQRVRHVVLGVGVNVNSRAFPASLAQVATSLRLVSGRRLERGALLAAFVNAFEPLYDGYLVDGPAAGLAVWRRHALLGQQCWASRGQTRIEGTAADVDDAGALVLRTAAGETIAVHAGEVHWL